MSTELHQSSKYFASLPVQPQQPLKDSTVSNTFRPNQMVETTLKRKREEKHSGESVLKVWKQEDAVDHSTCSGIHYPLDEASRRVYRTTDGKAVTQHRWDVYDLTRKIPLGTVTTYKHLCDALGSGSPRSVGSALRNNPFAPFVPCHRIIASDHFIGGFCGQWGLTDSDAQVKSAKKKAKTSGDVGKEDLVLKKMTMLAEEGVGFDLKGKVLDADRVIWNPAKAVK